MVEVNRVSLVTVIIPTYNRPILLERAVKSIKNQTYPNIEIIVVDDSNNPETVNLFKEDKHVKLLVNESNMGGCYSRNRGIKESSGEFINFLDDDDILYPTKIEKQVDLFKSNPNKIDELGMVTCHTNDGRTGKNIIKYNKFKGEIHKKLLRKFLISGIETVLYKREALDKVGGFDSHLPSSQEYDLQIRVSEFYNIDYVDEILTEEFKSEGQISVNFEKKLKGAKNLYAKYGEKFKAHGFWYTFITKFRYQLVFLKFKLAMIFGEKLYNKLLRK